MKIHATDAISALSELVEMGFTHDFRIQNGQLVDVSTGIRANPSAGRMNSPITSISPMFSFLM